MRTVRGPTLWRVPKWTVEHAMMPAMPAAEVVLPEGDGPHPAVVLGAEAYGVNTFIRGIQEKLVGLGYAVMVPDYYHGDGPAGKDSYDDFTEVISHIGRLDFTRGARDLAGAVDALRAMPAIDPRRIAVWGYCTGGTLAWLAACLRGDLAAAVLYFPSQPAFAELSPRTPVHPIDLLWQMTCPALFIYGDQDKLLSQDMLADMRARIGYWEVDAQVNIYPGAGHSFTCPWGPMRNDAADRAAWNDATLFLARHTRLLSRG
jgi:carboxymethylenebutenolidase